MHTKSYLTGLLVLAAIAAHAQQTARIVHYHANDIVAIEVHSVVLEDLRQPPYRAEIEFDKIFRAPGNIDEQRRERWTANVVYGFRDEVPNQMLLTNPLGLVITYCREDQAFGN